MAIPTHKKHHLFSYLSIWRYLRNYNSLSYLFKQTDLLKSCPYAVSVGVLEDKSVQIGFPDGSNVPRGYFFFNFSTLLPEVAVPTKPHQYPTPHASSDGVYCTNKVFTAFGLEIIGSVNLFQKCVMCKT